MKNLKNIKLSKYTTLKIGGEVENFYILENEQELTEFLKNKTKNIKILGGGSNILVSDSKLKFDVIKLSGEFENIILKNNVLKVGSAVILNKFLNFLADNELSGLEILAGIPGTIGGAVFGNAGTKYGNILEFVKNIKTIDFNGKLKFFESNQLNFGYRKSGLNKDLIILEIEFDVAKFKSEKTEVIKNKMQKFLQEKINSQPYDKLSAGCVFKNVKQGSVGKIIDELGLKGYKIGKVAVSQKHANFFVVDKDAKFADFMSLIEKVKDKIYLEKNIKLDVELDIWE